MKFFSQSLPVVLFIFCSLAFSSNASGQAFIASISPSTAPVGALVTITGTNFGATQGTSTVKFDGIPATVSAVGWSSTSIVATVPVNATSGNVVVTVGGVDSNGKSFTVGISIHIPRVANFGTQTNGAGKMQITDVRATINFPPATASVGLKFVSPDTFAVTSDKSWSIALTPNMPVNNSCTAVDPQAIACHDFPVPSNLATITGCPGNCMDHITIIPRTSSLAGPMRFEIRFALYSNYNVGGATPTTRCASTQTNDPEFYTIEVTSGTPLTGACVESYDRPILTCLNSMQQNILPPNEVFVEGFPQPTVACGKTDRPRLDVVMVLDRSGSMNTTTTSGLGTTCPQPAADTDRRIGALRCAGKTFLDDWTNPDTPNAAPAILGDRAGIVSFSSAASTDSGFLDVTSPADVNTLKTKIDAVTAGGSTSIGGGLVTANPFAWDNASRQAILLMTDGQQNTNPFVQADTRLYCSNPADPLCVAPVVPACTEGTSACSLPNHPQIYTVTLGPAANVSPAIDQQIANATLGFYLNTEDNPALLGPFFLELLQNFLKFNSYDTVRLMSKTTPYSAEVPISTTSRDVQFTVLWPSSLGSVRMSVTPPGGVPTIVKEGASGFLSIVRSLPLPAPFDSRGNWKIEVTATGPNHEPAPSNDGSIPFNLHVMTDDSGVKSDLSVVPGDYKPGDKIRLRAKITDFGLPILGLGSHPGDKHEVDLVRPGKSIGDILSDSSASAAPSGPDPQSPADAKLTNALQNNPSLLLRDSDTVQLFDDGKPEHGDDVAGDGTYSALYPATLPGHYNFLFSIESTDPNFIRFSRQQLRTAYVRAVPDAGNTVFQTSILHRENSNVLSIVMTPRFKPGPGCRKNDPKCGRMGPGWANYFWFTAPGVTPFKAVDNLDGKYTATLPFTGNTPPNVQVHFEDVVALIDDSVTPEHLPQPLGPGNVLTAVPPPNATNMAFFLDAGLGVPHGTFSSAFNTGFSLNAGLEYVATSHFSAEGIFGFHHFPAKTGSALDLYQFSANGKFYVTSSGPLRPFVNGGIGGYKFSPGSTYFGGNFGAGILYEPTPHWGFQGSYNFHTVNTPGVATKFSTIQGGIRFMF